MTFLASLVSWLFSLLSAAAVALLALPGAPVTKQDTVQKTLQWSGAPHRLEVSDIDGSVHVAAYDGRDVQVTARRSIEADTDARLTEGLAQLSFAENAGSILVCADAARCGCHRSDSGRRWDRRDRRLRVRIDFDVRVPRDAAVTVCTVNDGDVTVEGVAGDFDVSNVNGAVALSGMRGSGSAVTVNGGVTAAFAASPKAASTFKTVNGDIEARFPADLSADLRLKTMNGGLYTDFDVTARPSGASATVEHRNGRTVYRANDFATVRVGRGGPVLTFEGLNSTVRVLRAAH